MLEKIISNVNELNAAAMHLLQIKDMDALRKLAKTWYIPYQQTEDYIQGKRYRLAEIPITEKMYQNAAEKLRDEMLMLNDKFFADIVAWHMIGKCAEDAAFENQILARHKSLQKCLDHITGKAFELAQEQAKQKGLDRIPQNMGLALTEKEVFPWAEEYYQKQDEAETIKQEKEKREKILSEWEKLEKKGTVLPQKTVVGKKGSKKKTEEKTEIKNNVKAAKKKEAPQQMSLFDLQ